MNKYNLVISINHNCDNWPVPGIKIIRNIIGMSLKEAKALNDGISASTTSTTLVLNADQVARYAIERELSTSDLFPFTVHSLTVMEAPTHIDLSDFK